MRGSTRQTLRAGWQIATQHPALMIWYLRNRLRQTLIPWERRRQDGRSLPPRFVTLKPTLRCNLRCEFCRFVANGDVFGKRDWMEIQDWKRIVDEIAPHDPYVCITGGEPTMYPAIGELIAHIKRRGLTCVLTTNGTLLARRAAEFIEHPPDVVVLSIDGPQAVHDAGRGVAGAFDRALEGVEALRSRQRERRQRLPYLILNTAITGRTWESAVEMIDIARQFGAWAINFQHFWFMTRKMIDAHNLRYGDCFPLDFERIGGTDTNGVDPGALHENIERLKREDFGLPISFYPELTRETIGPYYADPQAFTHRHTPSCAWISTDIMPNGNVEPCFDLACGNVLEQPFLEIWNGETFRAHRRRLTTDGQYPVCARCCAYFRKD